MTRWRGAGSARPSCCSWRATCTGRWTSAGAWTLGQLATADLERALPLLLDMTDLVTAQPRRGHRHPAGREAGSDPRRRALVLALASDFVYGIRGGRRDAADRGDPLRRGGRSRRGRLPAPGPDQPDGGQGHRGRRAGHRAARPGRATGGRAATARLHDTADLHRGLWSRYTDDLDTARTALRPEHRPGPGRRATISRWPRSWPTWRRPRNWPATTRRRGARWTRPTPRPPGTTGRRCPGPRPRCELLIAAGRPGRRARPWPISACPTTADQPAAARFIGAWSAAGSAPGAATPRRGAALRAGRVVRRRVRVRRPRGTAGAGSPCWPRSMSPSGGSMMRGGSRPGSGRPANGWAGPALAGDAGRIDALAAAQAGDLDAGRRLARRGGHGARVVTAAPGAGPQPAGPGPDRAAPQGPQAVPRRAQPGAGPGPEMGHQPLLAQIERELPRVAAARSGDQLTVDRAAGRRPDRGRRDQPRGRRGAVRQRAHRRDPRRVHLPQARRAHPGRAGPPALRAPAR